MSVQYCADVIGKVVRYHNNPWLTGCRQVGQFEVALSQRDTLMARSEQGLAFMMQRADHYHQVGPSVPACPALCHLLSALPPALRSFTCFALFHLLLRSFTCFVFGLCVCPLLRVRMKLEDHTILYA